MLNDEVVILVGLNSNLLAHANRGAGLGVVPPPPKNQQPKD